MLLKINIVILSLFVGVVFSANEKYVRIGLDAKWTQTSIALEASEFLAAKSNEKFWNFIENMKKSSPPLSDKALYEKVLEQASLLLSETEVDTLKFSLSLRSYSPRIQLFQHMATEFSKDCIGFYQLGNGEISCDLNEVLADPINESTSLLRSFDHIYPGTESNERVVILYADFTSSSFVQMHESLLKEVKQIKYVLRHFSQKSKSSSSKVALSGYGVELAVKSTEYKAVDDQKVEDTKKKGTVAEGDDEVEGFLFKRLRELHPTLKDKLDQFKTHLKESNKDLAPLRVWQLQDLSFQAAQRIKGASSQNVLKVLKDLSQNVPMVARSLVKTTVNEDLRNEIKDNQHEFEKNGIVPGQTAVYINGIDLPVAELDAFKLLKLLNAETNSMSKFNNLDLENSKINDLLALNVKPEQESVIVDTRSDSVQWLNNLESDSQYNYWPSQLQEYLRPTFPGMMRYIAKNVFHVVAYVDPLSTEGVRILKEFNEFVDNSVPARFGIVFVAAGTPKDKAIDNAGAAIMRAFSFIKSDKSTKDAFSFLSSLYQKSGSDIPMSADIINLFTSWYGEDEATENLGPDSEYDDLRRVSAKVFSTIGLKALPQVLVNGDHISKDDLDNLESSISEKILGQTPAIQQSIYMGTHHAYPNIYEFLMSQPNVVSRINALVQNIKSTYVNIGTFTKGLKDNHGIKLLSKEEALGAIMNNVKYFIQDKGATTIWVIADATTADGRNLIRNALSFVHKRKNSRLALVLHGNAAASSGDINMNDVLQIISGLRQKLISGVAKLINRFLEKENEFDTLIKSKDEILNLATGITGINKKKLADLLTMGEVVDQARDMLTKNSLLLQNGLGIKTGENMVVANGRLLGPLKDEEVFVVDDFDLLQSFENNRCGFKVSEIIENMVLPKLPSEDHDRYKSDLMMKVSAILSSRDDQTRTVFTYKDDKHSVIHLPAKKKEAIHFEVEAVLDPLSKDAQKLSPILIVLHEAFNVNMKIFFNCKGQHSEIPVNRFYQYVLQPELNFDKDEKLVHDQAAIFTNLPHTALLTLIMDTPQSWLLEAVGSNQDLDNIHLAEVDEFVYGDFELENIIVEGHCSDVDNQQPPRGLQFILGTESDPEMFDTIVMANLGYFQLKAFPGSFVLQLRNGLSSQIYQINSLEGGRELSAGQNYTVMIDDFTGQFLKVQVKRRPGQEKADLLGEDINGEEDDGGLWNTFASYVKNKKSTKNTDGKIHIFSVATGLLYERFLRIMMLSVLKHTETPVKFWFLKNYLSSGFTKFLPSYAEKYGFDYELVQYQWPRWLNGQTEKQRIIWGYKILFLDVLFPLNLERIIFVDADQIVRADLKELMDMELDGAPYAYTPFCNDRPEVEGFRFWSHGYWRNHLAGRPYHISALYVVDLKRFRRVAAGDRLRGQYQGLSQDPNSLANLDQDLPNNMIHQVEIKSLPQEWLWCETWCSDESKKKAKTIDMCNNPQTKEPKLQRAIRIAPEWTEYDDIIRKLQEDTMKNNTQSDHIKKKDEL